MFPVVYGDVFDFALTLAELHRYCPLEMSQQQLADEVGSNLHLAQALQQKDGLYFLRGREELVAIRHERRQASEKGWRIARRVMRILGNIPFIRGVLVTGSLAVGNSRPGDDIDFLVMTSPNRFWFVFGFIGVLQRIFSRRFLCANYYLSVDHLRLPRENFYTAREVLQARPLFGGATCQQFQEANNWAFEHFPNAEHSVAADKETLERSGILGWTVDCFERLFGGRLGNALERFLRYFLKGRLFAHYASHGGEVPEDVLRSAMNGVELRFHGLSHEETIAQAFHDKSEEIDPDHNPRSKPKDSFPDEDSSGTLLFPL